MMQGWTMDAERRRTCLEACAAGSIKNYEIMNTCFFAMALSSGCAVMMANF